MFRYSLQVRRVLYGATKHGSAPPATFRCDLRDAPRSAARAVLRRASRLAIVATLCGTAAAGSIGAARGESLVPVWPHWSQLARGQGNAYQLAALWGGADAIGGLRERSSPIQLVVTRERTARGSAARESFDLGLPRASGLPWSSGNACGFAQFEAHRNRLSDVYTIFLGRDTRAGVLRRLGGEVLTRHVGRPGRVVVSWPMLTNDIAGQFDRCAAGEFDAYVRGAADIMRTRGVTNPLIRVGWEPNGSYPWSLGRRPAQWPGYNACFQRQATLFREELPDSLIIWDIRRDTPKTITYSPLSFYPGDAYVDIVGLMLYDRWPIHPDQAAWDSSLRLLKFGHPKGLDLWYEFATQVAKKPFALTEWAVSNNSNDPRSFDNPFFITKVFEWLQARKEMLAYESYFNCTGGYLISAPTQNPLSSAEYARLYRPGVTP